MRVRCALIFIFEMPPSHTPEFKEEPTTQINPPAKIDSPEGDSSELVEFPSGAIIARIPRESFEEGQANIGEPTTLHTVTTAANPEHSNFETIFAACPRLRTLGLRFEAPGLITSVYERRLKPLIELIERPSRETLDRFYTAWTTTKSEEEEIKRLLDEEDSFTIDNLSPTARARHELNSQISAHKVLKAYIHDLRNAAGTLFGNLELFFESNPSWPNQPALHPDQAWIQEILTASAAIQSLLNETPQTLDEALALAGKIAPLTVTHTSTDNLSTCPLSPEELQQVILNAAYNARNERANTLNILIREGTLLLIDNGDGFQYDSIEAAQHASHQRSHSNGNGLSIIQRIVQKYGGTTSLTNRPDGRGGAVLTLHFPSEAPTGEVDTSRTSIHLQTHQALHRAR